MTFVLLPVLKKMLEIYRMPRDFKRFEAYLQFLEDGKKGKLAVPIGGFNPMGKETALQKLLELEALEVEKIMSRTLETLNGELKNDPRPQVFRTAFNLSDDVQGGWTNRFTADFDSKFRFHGVFKFGFCVPVFWTGEDFFNEKIENRTREYVARTIFWSENPPPTTLRQHVEQEKQVAQKTDNPNLLPVEKPRWDFFEKHADSEDYHHIFWFFYGTDVCQSLGFPTFG